MMFLYNKCLMYYIQIELYYTIYYDNKNLLVSSTKSMTGHMLGGAGAIEAIISILAMNEGVVPPTINLEEQDPEVANLDYVPNFAREHKVDVALSNSFGFGGCNAVLVFTK